MVLSRTNAGPRCRKSTPTHPGHGRHGRKNVKSMLVRCLFSCSLGLLLCACAATSVKKTWKSPDAQNLPLKNIAVLTVDNRLLLRKGFENRLARQLESRGVSVVRSYETLSLPEIEQDKKAAAERLRAAGAPTIAILKLGDAPSHYRESRPGPEAYTEMITGYAYGPWYDYYTVAYLDMSPTY